MKLLVKTLVIEGMDLSGKSTLAEALSREFDVPVLHSPGPKSSPELVRWCAKNVVGRPDFQLILDRIPWVSEPIYGRVLRGGTFIHEEHGKALLIQNNIAVIYCHEDLDIRSHRIEGQHIGDQMEGVMKNYDKLNEAYREFFKTLPASVYLPYDYHDDSERVELYHSLKVKGWMK